MGNRMHNTQAQFRPPAIRDNRNRIPAERPKEKGKCWYCLENWTFGHKCNGVKSLLHAIQLQGHSDEEGEQGDSVPAPEMVQENMAEEEQLNLMSISSAALQGVSANDTISLAVRIAGVQIIALVDSGSSNTFLDKEFVLRHNLHTLPTPARQVTVAGGGTLISDAIVPHCKYTIQRKQFTTDFKVLPLNG
jgi:hypothetical protein